MCKAFNQIFTYTKQFNKPYGFLVIFNVTTKNLSFGQTQDLNGGWRISHGNKTIWIIVVDIGTQDKPVSQRGAAENVEIKKDDLIRAVLAD